MGSLTCQVTGYEGDDIEMRVGYDLTDGTDVGQTYGLELLYGNWKIYR